MVINLLDFIVVVSGFVVVAFYFRYCLLIGFPVYFFSIFVLLLFLILGVVIHAVSIIAVFPTLFRVVYIGSWCYL